MNIVSLNSKHWETMAEKGLEREVLVDTITQALNEAATHLPPLSPYLNIVISPDQEASIPETGDMGFTWDDELIDIYFDPTLPFGKESLLKNLRSTAFHELNHAARGVAIPFETTPIEALVSEGLATHFDKQYTGTQAPWGIYEDDATMQAWLEEVLALPSGQKHPEYLFDHSDGRRWIIYKTGTWIVDRVMAEGHVSLQNLTVLPAQEILNFLPSAT